MNLERKFAQGRQTGGLFTVNQTADKRHVIIIGLDGGTWFVLNSAVSQGYMPQLQKLMRTGAWGVLKSTMPAITPAAWCAFHTGRNSGATGVFNFTTWNRQTKQTHFVNSRSLPLTLWDIAGSQQKRIALLNVPLTYPPAPINGCVVSGLPTPSPDCDFTHPVELKNELLNKVPDYHIFNLGNIPQTHLLVKYESYVKQLADIVAARTKAAQMLISKEPWDIFMAHFQATDVLQHALWCYLDPCHPLYQREKHQYILENFYRRLDQGISTILQSYQESVRSEITSFILSDHGFQTHRKRFNLGNWLDQQGLLRFNPRSIKPPLLKKFTQTIRLGRMLGRFLSTQTVANMEKILKLDSYPYLWENTRAFPVGRGGEGFIYLLEEDPADREKTIRYIAEQLRRVCDPENEAPIVQKIHRKEELYRGEHIDDLPDLIVEPTPGYSFTADYQPNEGLFHEVRTETDFHLGQHHPDGIFLAAGADIASAGNLQADIIDMMPTLGYYLGVSLPEGLDGQIIESIFRSSFKSSNPPPAFAQISVARPQQKNNHLTPDEESQIRQKLRNLGYL